MSEIKLKQKRRARRKKRVSIKIIGTTLRPRVSIYRSNQHLFVQVIDDDKQVTIASGNDLKLAKASLTKTQKAIEVGVKLAESMKKLGIKSVVFDRGPYRYLGRVQAFADSLRNSGIVI